MGKPATISNDVLQHLSQMAAAYGYQLTPAAPPVLEVKPGNATLQRLLNKSKWNSADISAAVEWAEKKGLRVPGLFTFLKANS